MDYLLTVIIGIAVAGLFLYDPDLPFFLVIAGPFLLSWFVVVLPAVLCLGWVLKIAKALLARAGLAQLVFATAIGERVPRFDGAIVHLTILHCALDLYLNRATRPRYSRS